MGFRGIAAVLRDRIDRGELAPGVRLPSEDDLTVEFDCGRDAIRDALAVLNTEGYISKRRGFPTIVRVQVERTLVNLPPGAVVTARPMTMPEMERLDCGPGVAIIEVQVDGEHSLYRGDHYALTTGRH